MSDFGLRLLVSGSVVVMPRHKHAREGLFALGLVLAMFAVGWGALIWLNLR